MKFSVLALLYKAVPSKDGKNTYLTLSTADGSEYNLTADEPVGAFLPHVHKQFTVTGILKGKVYAGDKGSRQVLYVSSIDFKPAA